jgi:hypothetical protein
MGRIQKEVERLIWKYRKRIKVFNRKMHKIMKSENNVKILDISLDRSCYTRHGLHLNITGKEKVREMIRNQIRTFTTTDKENIIAQSWVCNPDDHCQVKGIDNISSEDEEPQQKEGKEGRKKGEDSESGNVSDCDQAIRVSHQEATKGNSKEYRSRER